MSFRELDIKRSYISYGDENIASSFLVPTLKHTKLYRRSVGFFSSSVFAPIIDGIVAMSRNDGNIQLIASPNLNEEDIEAINVGYKKREEIIAGAFERDFIEVIEELDEAKLQLLASLIANGTLDMTIFEEMAASTNYAPFILSKLAISLSIKSGAPLQEEVQIDSTMHYVGEHILKVVNNNLYIRKMLRAIIDFLKIAIDVVSSESPSTRFKSMFVVLDPAKKVDHDDIANFHNFIKMILKSSWLPRRVCHRSRIASRSF